MSQLRNMLQKVVNCQDIHKQTSAVQGLTLLQHLSP
jgi:DNA-binding FrmR family transcriptional regulator